MIRGVVVLAGIVGLTVFAAVEDTHPRALPTLLFVAAVVAILGLVSDASGPAPADWSPMSEYAYVTTGQDAGLAGNVRLLENHLTSREIDPLLQGRISRMTADRLARLGLSRGDPRVESALGPTLLSVIDGPPRPLRRDEIEECIRRIEELST